MTEHDVVLKIEMIDDVPAHVGTLRRDPVLGLLDSAENILANKLTAVVDRGEPRDALEPARFIADVKVLGERLLLLR